MNLVLFRYLDFMGDCWNDVPSKKDERRILIIQALIHTLNCVYEKQCFFPQSVGYRTPSIDVLSIITPYLVSIEIFRQWRNCAKQR